MADTIRRAPHNTDNPFAQISRVMLQDRTLSYEARGLLSYLLSKTGDWEVRVYDLKLPGCGRDKVYRVLEELRAHFYIGGHTKYQDGKGRWHWTPYDVYELPEFNPNTAKDQPFPEKPYTVEPHTENTEIKAVKKNTKKRKEKELALASQDAGATLPSLADEADDARMFSIPSRQRLASVPVAISPAKSPSPLKQKDSKTEDTTPPIPNAASPLPPTKTPKRSEKQLRNDALVEALRAAWFTGRNLSVPDVMGKRDYGLMAKTAQELVDGGITTDCFLAYVQYWHKAAATWPNGLTLHSLTNNGRMGDFLAFTAKQAPLTPAKLGYSKRNDPAYAYLYENEGGQDE